MTNWFTRNGKVLTVNSKIRGCCCDDVDDVEEDLTVIPFVYYDPAIEMTYTFQFDYAMYEFDLDVSAYGAYNTSINQYPTCNGLFTSDALFRASLGTRKLEGRVGRFKLRKFRNVFGLQKVSLPGKYYNWYLRTPTNSTNCPPNFWNGAWWYKNFYAERDTLWMPNYPRPNDVKFFYNYAFNDDILTPDPYTPEDFSDFNNIEITAQIAGLTTNGYFNASDYLPNPFSAHTRPPMFIYVAPQVQMLGAFLTLPYVTNFDPLPVQEGISNGLFSSKAFLEGLSRL